MEKEKNFGILPKRYEAKSEKPNKILSLVHWMQRVGYTMASVLIAINLISCSVSTSENSQITDMMEMVGSQQNVLYNCAAYANGVDILSVPAGSAEILETGAHLVLIDPFYVSYNGDTFLGATIAQKFKNKVVFILNSEAVTVQGNCIPKKAKIDNVTETGIVKADVFIDDKEYVYETVGRGWE